MTDKYEVLILTNGQNVIFEVKGKDRRTPMIIIVQNTPQGGQIGFLPFMQFGTFGHQHLPAIDPMHIVCTYDPSPEVARAYEGALRQLQAQATGIILPEKRLKVVN